MSTMTRLVIALVLLGMATPALAQKPATGATLPAVGEILPPTGAPGYPQKIEWLYDDPSATDAAGRIVIHWFCTPKISACVDDLARIVTLKENSRVYIVAYINGNKRDAKRLDPIRGSEGVGRGTLAYGKAVIGMFKRWNVLVPASVVVDVDHKVAFVSTGQNPAELDARDAKVNALSAAIKEYTAVAEGPKVVKVGEKFQLAITIKLASWLRYSRKSTSFKLTVPPDIKCDATSLSAAQLKFADQALTAQVTCSGPKGQYEARGQLNFGYELPGGAAGLGTDGASWKFEIKP